MSNFNEKGNRSGEKLTVAGIAAVIVVGVFVVCVILILAKSLFPSNESSVPDGIYTGTKPAASTDAAPDATSDAAVSEEPAAKPDDDIVVISSPDNDGDEDSEASSDSEAPKGDTAYLNTVAYLRASNDENAEPIISIAAGEEVTVIDRPSDSEYVHVNYNGYDGWVWNGYLD